VSGRLSSPHIGTTSRRRGVCTKFDPIKLNRDHESGFLFEHDLFPKTGFHFQDHALTEAHSRRSDGIFDSSSLYTSGQLAEVSIAIYHHTLNSCTLATML
jgi:hypothetical protein